MTTELINNITAAGLHTVTGKKILFANFPADGHFNPLTGLAVYLKNNGNDVRWYTSATYTNKLKTLQIPHYRYKNALDVPDNNFDAVFPERVAIKNQVKKLVFDMIHVFVLRGPEYYADIKDIYNDFAFDIVVCDIAFTGIPFITDKMNIPVVSIGIAPLMESSKDLPPYGLGLTPKYNAIGKLKQNALRFVADKFLFKPAMIAMKKVLSKEGIQYNGSNVFDILVKKSTVVLQIGCPGFEYKRSDIGSNICFAGSILPYSKIKTGKPWYNVKLDKYSKVVLTTQGTVEKDTTKLLVPVLEAFKNTDYLVVVTTGGSGTEQLRNKYKEDNVIIEDFIPFGDIMPYADVYITNGGYGGVMLSIENNLPMVVAGVHEGKNEINSRVGYFKLGINLNSENPAPSHIFSAVEKVTSGNDYYNNVKTLNGELKQYDAFNICNNTIAELLQNQSSNSKVLRQMQAADYN